MKPDLKKFREYGVRTVADLLSCDAKNFSERASLLPAQVGILSFATEPEDSSVRIPPEWRGCIGRFAFPFFYSFFSVDQLLDGGIHSGEVTEIVGTAGVGKSQICLSIATFVSMETKRNVLYIDTGGSFNVSRLREMVLCRDPSLNDKALSDILSRVLCVRAYDVYAVLGALEELWDKYNSEVGSLVTLLKGEAFCRRVGLVIVDCVASVITPILGGMQIHGHSLMVQLSRCLKSVAVECSLPVLITNNVVSDTRGPYSVKPALGQSWSHFPNTRVFIAKAPPPHDTSKGTTTGRVATILKSTRQPLQVSALFYFGSKGMLSHRSADGLQQ